MGFQALFKFVKCWRAPDRRTDKRTDTLRSLLPARVKITQLSHIHTFYTVLRPLPSVGSANNASQSAISALAHFAVQVSTSNK